MSKHHSDQPGSATSDAEKLAVRLAALTKRVTHLEKERIEMNQALQGLVDKLKTLEELAQHTADQLHQGGGGGGGGGVSQSDVQELEGYADRATQTLTDALQGGPDQGGNQGGNQTPPPPQQQPPPPQQPPQQKPTPAQMAAQILGKGRGKVS